MSFFPSYPSERIYDCVCVRCDWTLSFSLVFSPPARAQARELAEKEEGITELNREFRDMEEEVRATCNSFVLLGGANYSKCGTTLANELQHM